MKGVCPAPRLNSVCRVGFDLCRTSGRLDIPQFLEHLDAQKNQTYIHAEDWKKTNNDKEIQVYQDFAKSLYTGMSGEACEGETDCDDLNYPKEARGGIGS
eukprot:2275034-Amphidinium_carterae.1